MAPRRSKRSKSRHVQSGPSSIDTERTRFEALIHDQNEDKKEIFDKLVDAAGLEKVREVNTKLETLFKVPDDATLLAWHNFILGPLPHILKSMKYYLKLTDKDDGDKIETLIRCAHFIRFPEADTCDLTQEDMIAQLCGSSVRARDIRPQPEPAIAAEMDWSTEVVREGFNAAYQRSDLIVVPTLQKLTKFAGEWRPDLYKAPYTSIIGPTMCGKTRLLKELAAHVCVVYICLRDEKSTGQPPRSTIARHFFPSDALSGSMFQHYLHLLVAILNTVAEFFERKDLSDKSPDDQLSAWYDYSFQIDTPKAEYDDNIVKELKKIHKIVKQSSEGIKEEKAKGKKEDSKLISALTTATRRMNKSIKFKQEGELKVLLALDEASNLIKHTDKKLDISYFRVFRRVLTEVPSEKGFFAVFTDTTSRVANFNPALAPDRSARFRDVGSQLFEPIYKISTLDLFVPKAPSSWDELLSPQRLFSYGCPFYGLYFKGLKNENARNPHNAVNSTMMIGYKKLLRAQKLDSSSNSLTSSQCFAILGSIIQTRLPLYSPINSNLVSSHAAHCMFIDSTREMIVSDYPSQFIYASVANKFLAFNDARWIECLDILVDAVRKGFVALGDAGETATRLILIRAMQKTKPISPLNEDDFIPNGYSVRLVDFLHTLSGKDPQAPDFGWVEAGKQTDEDMKIFEANKKRLLDEGRIFFNHFGRISYTPSATDFLEFLYRGAAIQCKSQQAGFDELFTIYLEPQSKPSELDLENITFCGVQTKNQADYSTTDSYEWCKSFAQVQGINNPYLVLLFSLRATSQPKKWNDPQNPNDTGRVGHQFLGLDNIDCLTTELRSRLKQLIDARPDDLLNLYDKPDDVTEKWLKQLGPIYYPMAKQT